MAEAEFSVNDKRIEPGKRTAFFVYLVDPPTSNNPRYQVVPFKCTLKKLTIYFDSTCAFNVQIEVRIDGKLVARARGADMKVVYDLTEPIYPNSKITFESSEFAAAVSWNAVVYGEVIS